MLGYRTFSRTVKHVLWKHKDEAVNCRNGTLTKYWWGSVHILIYFSYGNLKLPWIGPGNPVDFDRIVKTRLWWWIKKQKKDMNRSYIHHKYTCSIHCFFKPVQYIVYITDTQVNQLKSFRSTIISTAIISTATTII